MKFGRRLRTPPHVPFIALADIAWQIIIFFLIGSTFARFYALNLASAGATDTATPVEFKQVEIIAGESKITVNGIPMRLENLETDLAVLLIRATNDNERAVILRPQDDLTFQRVAEIVYAIQRAGGTPVIEEERRENSPRQEK